MKRLLIIICFAFIICGCGKESKEDIVKDFTNKINSSKSYKIEGTMEISNDEETFNYSLESYYLKDNYYKVILVNQTNNNEQIILKNKSDIYVITPSLNKSFKFQSEWPENSSQAYLLGNIVNDIKKDKKLIVEKNDNNVIIKSAVNYPNNEELKYQKIYLKNKEIEKVEVYDEKDIVKIKVMFSKVDLKAGLKEDNFKLDEYIKNIEENKIEEPKNDNQKVDEKEDKNNNHQNSTGQNCQDDECQKTNDENSQQKTEDNKEKEEKTSNIENIIYPLYIPSNTYLTSSETIETANGNRLILTFSGEKNFVLIEEPSVAALEMEIIPVYGEPIILSEAIGALSANSLSWDKNNISFYLASTELTVDEMKTIANSLGNNTLVSSVK